MRKMIEIYSVTDNKSKSPYSYLHSYCCPKCACTDESMIVYDDDLVEEITTFGKNMFHEKHYTMLPHKCLACGEFYVVADIKELPNKDFTKAFIAVIITAIIQIVLFTIGIIRVVENHKNFGWLIGAISFILVTFSSVYDLSESMVRYKDDVGLDKIVEDTLNKRFVTWERFDENNHMIKQDQSIKKYTK
jgi:hypothetical protein